ncbi:hypothetical protein NM688_g9019 [Phlebia brevispora]|uniref:Uncharacterized protein n=1 Tax=Phlebia brevispora TaxID=194682 RepID=A0ACC1RM95_9APHY|nr:hypothetical protein NM688_g9019 [Phlebia brevispora]
MAQEAVNARVQRHSTCAKAMQHDPCDSFYPVLLYCPPSFVVLIHFRPFIFSSSVHLSRSADSLWNLMQTQAATQGWSRSYLGFPGSPTPSIRQLSVRTIPCGALARNAYRRERGQKYCRSSPFGRDSTKQEGYLPYISTVCRSTARRSASSKLTLPPQAGFRNGLFGVSVREMHADVETAPSMGPRVSMWVLHDFPCPRSSFTYKDTWKVHSAAKVFAVAENTRRKDPFFLKSGIVATARRVGSVLDGNPRWTEYVYIVIFHYYVPIDVYIRY